MSSKDNTADADIPDIDIPTWFDLHRLPYNDFIVTKLQMIDKDLCVEDLKLFKPHHIEALFGDAVLPELAGSEFVLVEFLRLGLGFLNMYRSLTPKSSQASSARSITI